MNSVVPKPLPFSVPTGTPSGLTAPTLSVRPSAFTDPDFDRIAQSPLPPGIGLDVAEQMLGPAQLEQYRNSKDPQGRAEMLFNGILLTQQEAHILTGEARTAMLAIPAVRQAVRAEARIAPIDSTGATIFSRVLTLSASISRLARPGLQATTSDADLSAGVFKTSTLLLSAVMLARSLGAAGEDGDVVVATLGSVRVQYALDGDSGSKRAILLGQPTDIDDMSNGEIGAVQGLSPDEIATDTAVRRTVQKDLQKFLSDLEVELAEKRAALKDHLTEEEKRRQVEEKQRREEAERKRKEEEAKEKKRREEAERKRKEEEAKEKKRKEAEAAEKKRKEEEEAEKKRKEKEEAEKKRKEKEAAEKKRKAEEDAEKKRKAEEAEAKNRAAQAAKLEAERLAREAKAREAAAEEELKRAKAAEKAAAEEAKKARSEADKAAAQKKLDDARAEQEAALAAEKKAEAERKAANVKADKERQRAAAAKRAAKKAAEQAASAEAAARKRAEEERRKQEAELEAERKAEAERAAAAEKAERERLVREEAERAKKAAEEEAAAKAQAEAAQREAEEAAAARDLEEKQAAAAAAKAEQAERERIEAEEAEEAAREEARLAAVRAEELATAEAVAAAEKAAEALRLEEEKADRAEEAARAAAKVAEDEANELAAAAEREAAKLAEAADDDRVRDQLALSRASEVFTAKAEQEEQMVRLVDMRTQIERFGDQVTGAANGWLEGAKRAVQIADERISIEEASIQEADERATGAQNTIESLPGRVSEASRSLDAREAERDAAEAVLLDRQAELASAKKQLDDAEIALLNATGNKGRAEANAAVNVATAAYNSAEINVRQAEASFSLRTRAVETANALISTSGEILVDARETLRAAKADRADAVMDIASAETRKAALMAKIAEAEQTLRADGAAKLSIEQLQAQHGQAADAVGARAMELEKLLLGKGPTDEELALLVAKRGADAEASARVERAKVQFLAANREDKESPSTATAAALRAATLESSAARSARAQVLFTEEDEATLARLEQRNTDELAGITSSISALWDALSVRKEAGNAESAALVARGQRLVTLREIVETPVDTGETSDVDEDADVDDKPPPSDVDEDADVDDKPPPSDDESSEVVGEADDESEFVPDDSSSTESLESAFASRATAVARKHALYHAAMRAPPSHSIHAELLSAQHTLADTEVNVGIAISSIGKGDALVVPSHAEILAAPDTASKSALESLSVDALRAMVAQAALRRVERIDAGEEPTQLANDVSLALTALDHGRFDIVAENPRLLFDRFDDATGERLVGSTVAALLSFELRNVDFGGVSAVDRADKISLAQRVAAEIDSVRAAARASREEAELRALAGAVLYNFASNRGFEMHADNGTYNVRDVLSAAFN